MDVLMLFSTAEHVAPTSDENVTVTDTELSGVAVRLFLPKKPADGLRRAVLYFHGGGWCVGDAGELSCQCQSLYWRSPRPIGTHSREDQGTAFQQRSTRSRTKGCSNGRPRVTVCHLQAQLGCLTEGSRTEEWLSKGEMFHRGSERNRNQMGMQ